MKRKILLPIVFVLAISPLLISGPSATANSYDERKEVHQTFADTRGPTQIGECRQDTQAQREFATAVELDSSLKADLEKSVDQIMKTRGSTNSVKP